MRGTTLCALILVAVAASAVNAQAQDPLSVGLLLADPSDCSSYYQFVPQLKHCPQGLVFNSKEQVCDWPANVNCACNGTGGGGGGSGGNGSGNGGNGGGSGGNGGGNGTGNGGNGGGSGGNGDGSGGNGGGSGGNGSGNGGNGGGSGGNGSGNGGNGSGSGGNGSGNGGNGGGSGGNGGDCPTRGQCPAVDPLDHTVHLPHLTDCSLFCRCDNGIPKLDHCPTGLEFNPVQQVCDWPASAGCVVGVCQPLSNNNRSHWEPSNCSQQPSELGDTCRLACDTGYELSGSSQISCTEAGWDGSGGVDQVPTCKTVEELGEDFVNNINDTLGKTANLLFVLDESGSVGQAQFDMELKFVKAIVNAFPLSVNRSAGVITFSSGADVDITLRESNTCNFLKKVGSIRYSQGGTDILAALNRANQEILVNAVHNLTLVFLITDGQSSTDATPAAEAIKKHNDVLFSVGVGGYDANQLVPLSSVDKKGAPLFYGIRNFEVFNAVANYLNTQYNNNNTVTCP